MCGVEDKKIEPLESAFALEALDERAHRSESGEIDRAEDEAVVESSLSFCINSIRHRNVLLNVLQDLLAGGFSAFDIPAAHHDGGTIREQVFGGLETDS